MREIYKLNFESEVWLDFNRSLALSVKREKDGSFAMRRKTKKEESKRRIAGAAATTLENKLNALALETWGAEYEDPHIRDGEEWSLSLEFVDGGTKTVRGLNGYPENWRAFMKMLDWLKR